MVKYNCRGYRFNLPGPWSVELWICPPKAAIKMHTHPDVDSHIFHIWGKVTIMKELKIRVLPRFTFFALFHIMRGIRHGFVGCKSWFVFVNFEKWHIAKQQSIALNLKEI